MRSSANECKSMWRGKQVASKKKKDSIFVLSGLTSISRVWYRQERQQKRTDIYMYHRNRKHFVIFPETQLLQIHAQLRNSTACKHKRVFIWSGSQQPLCLHTLFVFKVSRSFRQPWPCHWLWNVCKTRPACFSFVYFVNCHDGNVFNWNFGSLFPEGSQLW